MSVMCCIGSPAEAFYSCRMINKQASCAANAACAWIETEAVGLRYLYPHVCCPVCLPSCVLLNMFTLMCAAHYVNHHMCGSLCLPSCMRLNMFTLMCAAQYVCPHVVMYAAHYVYPHVCCPVCLPSYVRLTMSTLM
jgi:hypothetical protein